MIKITNVSKEPKILHVKGNKTVLEASNSIILDNYPYALGEGLILEQIEELVKPELVEPIKVEKKEKKQPKGGHTQK